MQTELRATELNSPYIHTYILQHHRHFIIDFISLLCLKGPDQLQVSVVLNKQSLLYKTDERCTGAGGVCVCVSVGGAKGGKGSAICEGT